MPEQTKIKGQPSAPLLEAPNSVVQAIHIF